MRQRRTQRTNYTPIRRSISANIIGDTTKPMTPQSGPGSQTKLNAPRKGLNCRPKRTLPTGRSLRSPKMERDRKLTAERLVEDPPMVITANHSTQGQHGSSKIQRLGGHRFPVLPGELVWRLYLRSNLIVHVAQPRIDQQIFHTIIAVSISNNPIQSPPYA